ncbi:hypothetical protein [Leptolyngbya sp. KIOST-1]|uniref:hypothetical protein n=1 Tax=Leptolyngbya sp. KIOST-1 TaxID=1229172 RepID=UPI000B1422B2|nr:hypothetical protein [Leptolyngbya sp. KIOST-1]
MAWRQAAGGCLALLLGVQAMALADSGTEQKVPAQTLTIPDEPSDENPLPWSSLLEGNPQSPLLGTEYNRVMAALWADLKEGWDVRSHHITTACDALGSDMAYLRGRVPRQIEDAHRQMAPFQTKALSAPAPAQRPPTGISFSILTIDDAEPEAVLELIRAGDPSTYATYEQLLWRFGELDLAAYLDAAQDNRPLARGEFLAHVEVLHRELQDPTRAIAQHEDFLREADRHIQDLLAMLREVRRSLATLEVTKSNVAIAGLPSTTATKAAPQGLPREAIASPISQPARAIAWTTIPAIALEDSAPVTRRDFLLAMLALVDPFTQVLHRPTWCGGYRVESFANPAEEIEREIWYLMQALDQLNAEILTLTNARSR